MTDATHVADCLDTSDPNGQPAFPLSQTATIAWQTPPVDPLTSQKSSLKLTPADIEQNIIDDCSVCASVAVCVQHNQRFNSKVCFHFRLLT